MVQEWMRFLCVFPTQGAGASVYAGHSFKMGPPIPYHLPRTPSPISLAQIYHIDPRKARSTRFRGNVSSTFTLPIFISRYFRARTNRSYFQQRSQGITQLKIITT